MIIKRHESGKFELVGLIQRNAESGSITFIASTDSVDRADDIVVQNWDLSEFDKNPVILYQHDHRKVVGRGSNARKEVGQLVIDVEMDHANPDPFVQGIAHQVDKEFIRAVSVGFMPGSVTWRSDLPKEHAHYKEEGWGMQLGSDEHPNVLLELSIVSLGMNEEAQRRSTMDDTLLEAKVLAILTNHPEARALFANAAEVASLASGDAEQSLDSMFAKTS